MQGLVTRLMPARCMSKEPAADRVFFGVLAGKNLAQIQQQKSISERRESP